jgi:hypothetical protein
VEGSWYAARPAIIGTEVMVRVFELELEIFDLKTLTILRRHPLSAKKGEVKLPEEERIYNPSRQTAAILNEAKAIGPKTHALCLKLFENEGRSGHRRLRGIVSLSRKHPAYRIEQACDQALNFQIRSYKTIVQMVEDLGRQEQKAQETETQNALEPHTQNLTQTHELIRDPQEYFDFWKSYANAGETIH